MKSLYITYFLILCSTSFSADFFSKYREVVSYDDRSSSIENLRSLNMTVSEDTIRVNFLHSITHSYVTAYLHDVWKAKRARGEKFSSFEEFNQEEWPVIRSALKKWSDTLSNQAQLLQKFVDQKKDGVDTRTFYRQLSKSDKQQYRLRTEDEWVALTNYAPDVDSLNQHLAILPKTAREAYETKYGEQFDFEKFLDAWTIKELESIRPGIVEKLTSASIKASMPGDRNPTVTSHLQSSVLSTARIYLTMPCIVNEIEFSNQANKNLFNEYLDDLLSTPLHPELPPDTFKNRC